MSVQIIRKLATKTKRRALDPEKEKRIKDLISKLSESGYAVRREKLKRGHGWKVSSGSCFAQGERFIFVDSQLSQDEQLAFLLAKVDALLGDSIAGQTSLMEHPGVNLNQR